MLTVLRVFLIDSMAYENVKTQVTAAKTGCGRGSSGNDAEGDRKDL